MHLLAIVLFLLSSPVPEPVEAAGRQEVLQAHQQDTLRAATISSTFGSLVVPQTIKSEELRTVTSLPEAIRRFSGVQIRDYGGVGGLKTVNVRSLGSEHTGVFIDGIQVDNAQNMQVDLGRFGLDDLAGVSLFSGQKTAPLQSAKEYSSASSLYLETAAPSFKAGSKDNWRIGAGSGSFGTISPKVAWEHLFGSGASLRLGGEGISSNGRYRFHVKDFRQYQDGSIAGYDTTMVRQNCDLRSIRLEGGLFCPSSAPASWNIRAYFYDSERGLPGPVYKRVGDYPLSDDRQSDRDAFLQGRYVRQFGDAWTVSARAKYSYSHLEYVDFPELRPELQAAHFNYRNSSAYASAAAMFRSSGKLKFNFAQDLQYDYLDSDMQDFAYPGRLSSWTALSAMAGKGPFDVSSTFLCLVVRDSFLSGGKRHSARRSALMPSVVARWKPSARFSMNGFAKRSYRMPTFNDLYYTTVGSKTLDPEDALQFDLGAVWMAVRSSRDTLALKVDLYRNYLKNKIIAVPTSNQFRWSMYNLGKVAVFGTDVVADYSHAVGRGLFGATARYTLQLAKDRTLSTGSGTGEEEKPLTWNGQIPYIPVHSGSVNLFGALSGWRADVTFFATGERYTTSANLPAYRLDPWATLDAAISKTLELRSSSLRFKISLNNLLDEQYEIVDNYPMPGFNFFLKAEYLF